MVKHILVVNPNVIEAEKIKSRMGSSTTNVVCAYTIQQAIRYFDEIEFCLVILDANISASDDRTLLVQIFVKQNMPTGRQTLFQKCRSLLKKQTKRAIG